MRNEPFPRGSRWRVVRPGAAIAGMVPSGPGCQTFFRRPLAVGDVLTSLGTSMTMGDGVPALKWGDEAGENICNDAVFEPHVGTMWQGLRPDPSYLEPADG